MQASACEASRTAEGKAFTDGARGARDVTLDPCKPQPITLFDNSPQPIRLIVLLDVSGSMEGNLQLLREGCEELFRRLRTDDGIRVGTFGHDVSISPTFTRDPRELRASLPHAIAPDAPTPWAELTPAGGIGGRAWADAGVIVDGVKLWCYRVE